MADYANPGCSNERALSRPAPSDQWILDFPGDKRGGGPSHRRSPQKRPAYKRGFSAGDGNPCADALAAARVFEEHPDRRFSLTPMGEYLRSDLTNSRRAWAELIGRPYVRQSWSALEDTVRTGETAFRRLHGTGIWEWRSENPEERAIFDAAMTGLSRMAAHAVTEAYDFSALECVVDVGGGQGALLAEILSRHARLKGILFDLPSVVAGAQPVLEGAGVVHRCGTVAGDIFTAVPEGGDAYIIKSVLMHEDDDNAIRILSACRRSMKPSAKLSRHRTFARRTQSGCRRQV